ncbi:FAD-binding domain-containing protein [Coprinellus micaceus]|uniref:FAD-binding domain-containing protein n=1 Tax=Coprinellus micaceus TaxID=71717 RepID=A0A4Y7SMH0_COPMI|nr:FAD-binding domain-containing protein [Coprinellus micaceus]
MPARTWKLAVASALLHSSLGLARYNDVCSRIATSLSASSALHSPGNDSFTKLSSHWTSSSDESPACVAEPRTTDDVAKILKIVAKTRTPFAVQGAGHATNRGFSSTEGVHISTQGFTSVEYNDTKKTVTFGAGLTWDKVYEALEPHGVNVAGGRAPGVGVGGLILGGGYSWHTNQYGLTIDTVEAFELVKPNGEAVEVTHESDPELFFALKGGGNNFGVVTKFTMKTFPQGKIWGGMITYGHPDTFAAVTAATAKFSAEVTDPKASLLSTVTFYQGMPLINIQLFYDGPEPPAGIFDDFLKTESAASTVATQTFSSMINNVPAGALHGVRGAFLGFAAPAYSLDFLNAVNEQAFTNGAEFTNSSLVFLTLVSEPFLQDILSHNKHDTAYPFNRAEMYTPFNIFIAWADPSKDEWYKQEIEKIRDVLQAKLIEEGYEGVTTAPVYSNYALWDAPAERLYGSNLPKLQEIKRKVDPEDVMGLAGGFKITPKAMIRDEL